MNCNAELKLPWTRKILRDNCCIGRSHWTEESRAQVCLLGAVKVYDRSAPIRPDPGKTLEDVILR